MQSRFAIVLMSIAGAAVLFGIGFAFGLGVLTSPPAAQQQHKQIAVADQPTKVTRTETTGQTSHDDRALTPLYPTAPGGAQTARPQGEPAASNVATQPAPPQDAQHAAPTGPTQQAAEQQPKAQQANAAPAPQPVAHAEPASAPKNATPVTLQGRNACAIDACTRAYHSFRASDCTYQPYSGPRQLCVNPPGSKEASRSDSTLRLRVRRGERDIQVQDVPRERDAATDGRSTDDEMPLIRREYRRDFAADGEDDGIDDGRVIVRRSYDGPGWGRGVLAPPGDDGGDDQ